MSKILIGMICDGKAGGIDKYLLNFYNSVKSEEHTIDFLTNNKDEGLEQFLNKNGSKLYSIATLMHPVKQYAQAKRLIEENGYDVVYMNISTALCFPVLKAAYDLSVKKVILHSHSSGYDCENPVKRKIFTLLHLMCKGLVTRYANSFLCCSDKAAEWMFGKKIIKEKKYKIIYNAVDTSAFAYSPEKRRQFREELNLGESFVIGNVGNLCYQKNPLFLIDVFNKLLKTEPDSKLVIIGDGVLLPKVKERIKKYGIEDKVILLGRVDVSKGYMNAFDVFALPSNFEGLGIVYIEAQYTKVPCVASSFVPSLAKISNMFSFVPFDTQSWAKAILSYKNTGKDDFVFEVTESFDLSRQAEELNCIIDIEKDLVK